MTKCECGNRYKIREWIGTRALGKYVNRTKCQECIPLRIDKPKKAVEVKGVKKLACRCCSLVMEMNKFPDGAYTDRRKRICDECRGLDVNKLKIPDKVRRKCLGCGKQFNAEHRYIWRCQPCKNVTRCIDAGEYRLALS